MTWQRRNPPAKISRCKMPSKDDHKLYVAIAQLLLHLPECVHGYYWNTAQLQSILEAAGGFEGLPEGVMKMTMRTQYFLCNSFHFDRFDNVSYYMFGGARSGISCYADQISLASSRDFACSIMNAKDYFENESMANPQTELAQALQTVKNYCQKQRNKQSQGPGSGGGVSIGGGIGTGFVGTGRGVVGTSGGVIGTGGGVSHWHR